MISINTTTLKPTTPQWNYGFLYDIHESTQNKNLMKSMLFISEQISEWTWFARPVHPMPDPCPNHARPTARPVRPARPMPDQCPTHIKIMKWQQKHKVTKLFDFGILLCDLAWFLRISIEFYWVLKIYNDFVKRVFMKSMISSCNLCFGLFC